MRLPSGHDTTNYGVTAASKGWGAGWTPCTAINNGLMRKVTLSNGCRILGGVHQNIAELFTMLGNEITRRGHGFHDGWCWGAECRSISGTTRASNHSWGLAVDLDAPNNPYTSSGQHDIPDWAFTLFRQYGFGVGADYSGKKDWMHVEFMGTLSDAAIMTGLARKNLGGGIVPPIDTPTGDEWLTVGALEQIIAEIRYGNDKVMEGKAGEAPDHNIAQVKAKLDDAIGRLERLEARIFNRDPGSRSIVDEIHFGNNQILGRLPK